MAIVTVVVEEVLQVPITVFLTVYVQGLLKPGDMAPVKASITKPKGVAEKVPEEAPVFITGLITPSVEHKLGLE